MSKSQQSMTTMPEISKKRAYEILKRANDKKDAAEKAAAAKSVKEAAKETAKAAKAQDSKKRAILKEMRRVLKVAKAAIVTFKHDVSIDTLSAIEHMGGVVSYATIISSFEEVESAIVDIGKPGMKQTLATILVYALDQIRRLSTMGAPRSSVFLASQIQIEKIRAWRKIVEIFEWDGHLKLVGEVRDTNVANVDASKESV